MRGRNWEDIRRRSLLCKRSFGPWLPLVVLARSDALVVDACLMPGRDCRRWSIR